MFKEPGLCENYLLAAWAEFDVTVEKMRNATWPGAPDYRVSGLSQPGRPIYGQLFGEKDSMHLLKGAAFAGLRNGAGQRFQRSNGIDRDRRHSREGGPVPEAARLSPGRAQRAAGRLRDRVSG